MEDDLTITRFDIAEYIDTPEAEAELLSDAFETGDAHYIAHALGIIARARGISALARDTGLNRQSLYSALSETGNPTLDTLLKVTKALGLKLNVAAALPVSASA